MRKQFMKRKKLGMALIFTLMVVLVSVAIASSYIDSFIIIINLKRQF